MFPWLQWPNVRTVPCRDDGAERAKRGTSREDESLLRDARTQFLNKDPELVEQVAKAQEVVDMAMRTHNALTSPDAFKWGHDASILVALAANGAAGYFWIASVRCATSLELGGLISNWVFSGRRPDWWAAKAIGKAVAKEVLLAYALKVAWVWLQIGAARCGLGCLWTAAPVSLAVWLVVLMRGVNDPMVGWKLAVASQVPSLHATLIALLLPTSLTLAIFLGVPLIYRYNDSRLFITKEIHRGLDKHHKVSGSALEDFKSFLSCCIWARITLAPAAATLETMAKGPFGILAALDANTRHVTYLRRFDVDAPAVFTCTISADWIHDPVLLHGRVYGRQNLAKWFATSGQRLQRQQQQMGQEGASREPLFAVAPHSNMLFTWGDVIDPPPPHYMEALREYLKRAVKLPKRVKSERPRWFWGG